MKVGRWKLAFDSHGASEILIKWQIMAAAILSEASSGREHFAESSNIPFS
jgi:hypothetical protein